MLNRFPLATLLLIVPTVSWSGGVVSDGSLGAFSPAGSQTINLESVAPDGVLNYTTVNIPAGVTISFSANAANTPVFIAATGNVVIDGQVNVSGGSFSTAAGAGGGAGGASGSGATSGQIGFGLSPGLGGASGSNAGGGGGMATAGLVATSRTGASPAPGGAAIAAPSLAPGVTGGGGSGGGGGGGRLFFGVPLDGGVGGGAGGAVQVSAQGQLTINGTIRANGGHGGWGFANALAFAGPGGGGSGGLIELYGAGIDIGASALLQAIGGAGGGLSTEPVPNDPYFFSSGAHGGLGYLRLVAGNVVIDPAATIDAEIVPDTGTDTDNDGVLDSADNCTAVANADQRDTNGDGFGNLCDPDLDNDCAVNFTDLQVMKAVFFGTDADADFDGDGSVNFADLNILKTAFFGEPGPSGVTSCPE